MIRFLQKENIVTKLIFGAIITVTIVFMVITLVPGIFDSGVANDATVFATVRTPGYFGRFAGDSTSVKMDDVVRETQSIAKRNGYPDYAVQFLLPRVGQQVVERAVLVREAEHLGLAASPDDVRRELQKGMFAQYLFPNGQFIGDDKYMDFVQTYFGVSVKQFETEVKEDLEVQRLRAFVTGGITVNDAAVRAAYMKQGAKVQFEYAVITADDLKKKIAPTDAELEQYFNQNQARYATAVPEQRKLQFFSISNSDVPGANAAPTDAEIQSYYSSHADQYKVAEQVHARHILIAVPRGANAQVDAAAKAKAEDVLKQIQAGGNFAELAKKYSDDPGSKDKGGDLGMQNASMFVPAFSKAAMALQPGQTSGLVKTDFGYHIIQTLEKTPAHVTPLADVKGAIAEQLTAAKSASAAQNYANQLAAEAKSKGMAATADAHHLHLETTDFVGRDGTIPSLADSSQVLTAAFGATQGAAPQVAPTGEGFAIFQVEAIQKAHAPTFAAWKSHVLDDYTAAKVPEMMNEALAKLASQAKALGDLKAAAAAEGVALKTSDLVGRDGQVTDLGAMSGAASVAFDLPKGGISGPLNNGASGAVLEVLDKQEPSADDVAKNLPTMRDKLLADQQDQAFAVFAGEVMKRYENAGAIVYAKKQLPGGPFGN